MKLPLIAVNLSNKKDKDDDLCPPIIRDELALHIPFKQKAIQWAIDNWIKEHNKWIRDDEISPIILSSDFYKELGL